MLLKISYYIFNNLKFSECLNNAKVCENTCTGQNNSTESYQGTVVSFILTRIVEFIRNIAIKSLNAVLFQNKIFLDTLTKEETKFSLKSFAYGHKDSFKVAVLLVYDFILY